MFRREPLSRNLLRRPVVAPRFSIGPCRALNFHKHPMCIIRDDCLTTRIATDLAFKADKRSEARLIEGTRRLSFSIEPNGAGGHGVGLTLDVL